MTKQTIRLPSTLNSESLIAASSGPLNLSGHPPEEVVFDFISLNFAKPSGIVLLHNLTKFLIRSNVRVFYHNYKRDHASIRFLDDIGFFEDHLERKAFPNSSLRETTCRLVEIATSEMRGWLERAFIPWLSRCTQLEASSFAEVSTCILEISNNIQDHTDLEIGSVFAQWYPKGDWLEICIADFGRGIPANVRRIKPCNSDALAISAAFEEGFTTKTTPRNRGVGLHFLRQNIVDRFSGVITVTSGVGRVNFQRPSDCRTGVIYGQNEFCRGTLINITLPTGGIKSAQNVPEDLTW